MDDEIFYVDVLMLGVGGADDVGELEEFSDERKDGLNGFMWMINCLLYPVLALEEFV